MFNKGNRYKILSNKIKSTFLELLRKQRAIPRFLAINFFFINIPFTYADDSNVIHPESKIENSIVIHKESKADNVSLTTSANALPVLNIAKPNDSGISNNKFDNFNVNKEGLIINNSSHYGNSVLGGQVLANPNMQSPKQEAKIIINQVLSNQPSSINGATEIFGQKAAYILSNPNGISINGGALINASSATVTSGNVSFKPNGKLDDIITEKGNVHIYGRDINNKDLDYYSIISKTANIQAKIHAKEVEVITGSNAYDHKSKKHTSLAKGDNDTSVSIDSSLLGGIYADRIKIISTSEGVGVKAPKLSATSSIDISADGKITHRNIDSGRKVTIQSVNSTVEGLEKAHIKAKENIIVETKDTLEIKKSNKYKANYITLKSGADIINNGTIKVLKDGDLLAVSGSIINNAILDSSNDLKIDAGEDITNKGLIKVNGGKSSLKAGKAITNEGKNAYILIDGKELDLKAGSLNNTGIISLKNDKGDIEIENDIINNEFYSKGNLTAKWGGNFDSKMFIAEGDVNLKSKDANNKPTIINRGFFQVTGKLSSDESISIENLNSIDEGGNNKISEIIVKGEADLKLNNLNNQGKILGDSLKIQVHNSCKNIKEAIIGASESLILKLLKASKKPDELTHENEGGVQANAKLNIESKAQITNSGEIRSLGEITLESDSDIYQKGKIKATGILTIGSKNRYEAFSGSETISSGAANINGNILNLKDGSKTVSKGDLKLEAKDKLTNSGIVQSEGTALLESGTLANLGKIYGNKIDIKASAVTNNVSGLILASNGVNIYDKKGNKNDLITNFGTIESLGGVSNYKTKSLLNKNESFSYIKYKDQELLKAEMGKTLEINKEFFPYEETPAFNVKVVNVGNYTTKKYTLNEKISNVGKAAQILSGGIINIDSNSIENKQSIISAQNIHLDGTTLSNEEIILDKIIAEKQKFNGRFKVRNSRNGQGPRYRDVEDYYDMSLKREELKTIPSTIYAAKGITGNLSGMVSNGSAVSTSSNNKIPASGIDKEEIISKLNIQKNADASLSDKTLSNDHFTKIALQNFSDNNLDDIIDDNKHLVINSMQAPDFNVKIKEARFKHDVDDPELNYKIEVNPKFTDARKYFTSSDFLSRVADLKPEKLSGKSLSDYHENKFIRDQIISLTGSNVYDGEFDVSKYSTKLKNNALIEGKRLNLAAGISLSPEMVAKLSDDIVWMEEVTIAGVKKLVPRVYFASNKQKTSGIKADVVDLTAGSILNLAAISGRVVRLHADGKITNFDSIEAKGSLDVNANGGIDSFGGKFYAGNELVLASSEDINNISSSIESGGSAKLKGKNINNITNSYRIGSGNNFDDHLQAKSTIKVAGRADIEADKNYNQVGSSLKVGSGLVVAGEDVIIEALAKESKHFNSFKGGYNNNYNLNYSKSNVESAGDFTVSAGGNVARIGADYKIGGDSTTIAAGAYYEGSVKDIHFHDSKTSSGRKHNRKESSDYGYNESLVGGSSEIIGRNLIKAGNVITLDGVSIAAGGGTKVSAPTLDVKAAVTKSEHASYSSKRNAVWQNAKGSNSSGENVQQSNFVGGLDISDITQSVSVELKGSVRTRGKGFMRHSPEAAPDLTNYAWLAEAKEKGLDVKVTRINEHHSASNFKRRGLTPEATIAIGAIAAIATAGASLGASSAASATLAQTVVSASLSAAASSVSTQFTIGTINNGGNLERGAAAIKFKEAGRAALVAGATAGINQFAGIEKVSSAGANASTNASANAAGAVKTASYAQQAGNMVARSAVSAGVGSAVYGDKFAGRFKASLALEVADKAFEKVGDVAAAAGLRDGGVAKVAMHAGVGGVASKAMGGDFASGAIAAGSAELASPLIDKASTNTATKVAIAGAIGSVASLAIGSDAKNIGYSSSISSSSRANNRELHSDEQQVLALASKGKTEEEKRRLLAASVYLVHGENVNANGLKSPELKRLAELGKGYHAEQDQLVKLASGLGYKDAFLYDVTHAGKDFILSNFDVIDRSIEVYDSFTEPSYKESFSDLRAGAIAAVSIFPFSRVAGSGANGAKVLSGAKVAETAVAGGSKAGSSGILNFAEASKLAASKVAKISKFAFKTSGEAAKGNSNKGSASFSPYMDIDPDAMLPKILSFPIAENKGTILSTPEEDFNKYRVLPGFEISEYRWESGILSTPDQRDILNDWNIFYYKKVYPDSVKKVNNRYPINGDLAGQKYPIEKLPKALQEKYPDSVLVDIEGYLRFEPYTYVDKAGRVYRVELDKITGDYRDNIAANKAMGITKNPNKYVWHHVEDTKTLIAIPEDLHNAIKHTGGRAVNKGSFKK